MSKASKQLADWAIKKIETDYPNDVCLLIEHTTHILEKDLNDVTFGFYIPATNRANGLNKTFIINGIGHDMFPMPWDRIENMADAKDYNLTCLIDGKIIWARSDADRQRFESLQTRLQANLQNPQYMLERAQKWLETVNGIFQDTLFETRLYKVRENAGHICDLLARAVGLLNNRWFKHGQTHQLSEVTKMDKLPENFTQLYRNIVAESCPDAQKRLCHEMITATKALISSLEESAGVKHSRDFAELAMWYQETSYWWRRVYHWCETNDPINAYIWGCSLQMETEEWGAKFGIAEIDIMGAFDANNLAGFQKQAMKVETAFRQAIEDNGVRIDEYKSIDDFLAAN